MIIGIPKEIKEYENRVALHPGGVVRFLNNGHSVYIEKGAGLGSGFPDQAYSDAGATIVEDAVQLWSRAEMVMKVKEPLEVEYERMRPGQIIFAFFHFAADRILTEAVMDSGCIAIACETVENREGRRRSLPILIPMSEVAGRMAAQQGAKYLEKPFGGRGILMGGIPGVLPARVLVIGGGVVGINAARVASGMGADTIVMDINSSRIRYLDELFDKRVRTLYSSESNINRLLPDTDLVIGAALAKPGAKTPKLITRKMLGRLKPGSVLVDVAIDQGGCFETSRPTTHDNPVYRVDEIVHYCVTNMPGAVPYTSTQGLVNATLPYALQIADMGLRRAFREDPGLGEGLNVAAGKVVNRDVAETFGWVPAELDEVLTEAGII